MREIEKERINYKMKPRYTDITGNVYGDIRVLGIDPDYVKYPQRYICECKCGETFSIVAWSLTAGEKTCCLKCSYLKARKVSDDVLLESYGRLKNIWKVAAEVGLCGQSINERLIKLGAQE